jgi:hypothetical protein
MEEQNILEPVTHPLTFLWSYIEEKYGKQACDVLRAIYQEQHTKYFDYLKLKAIEQQLILLECQYAEQKLSEHAYKHIKTKLETLLKVATGEKNNEVV